MIPALVGVFTNKKKICFDNCFDEICDGPTGCLAWYTNPGIAVMVIAYCTMKTS
jgi:hypothetical protein